MASTLQKLRAATPMLWRGLAAVLALVFAAAPNKAALAASATPTKLTISYSEKIADELALWIADDAGYFKAQGLDVTELYLPSQEGLPALLTGQVQMAAIGGGDALAAAAQGVKLKYVANFSPVYTFQFWARPQYAQPNLLKGQRIGITSTSGSLYIATLLALRQLGLSPGDVELTPLGSTPNVDSALFAGSIVAAASHPPATYRYQQQGFVDMVDLAQKRIPNVNTGLLVLDSYIQAKPEIVTAVVEAITEGFRREKADKAYAENEMRQHMGIKDQDVLDFTYNFYANEVAPTVPLPDASQLEVAKQALSATNAKLKTVDPSLLIDQSFAKAAAARLNIK
ncbi:MAG TPA: ABC transporter substrate-binding protein [Xanthobacteraceae bacterium]|nr:ABC transporter substrate-binding protein [Xanthobacteraceae bacterium]